MRNLKKILALVLALVMSMSLVTIANASDFTDADEITYEEAVDVMSAVGVLNGLETGAFNPTGTLTREQAAKIICYLLLGENAEKLGVTNSGFSDVAANRWSAPYIAYCSSLGIVAGNGDGTFNPTGKLTGHAFGKMLLVALGFEGEYTGSKWAINVAADLVDAELDENLADLTLSAPISREQASQMALNAAKYTTSETVYAVKDGDKTVTFDNMNDAMLYVAIKNGAEYIGETKDYSDSLLKKVFNVTVDDGVDTLGRPATTYANKDWDEELAFADAADYTIVVSESGKTASYWAKEAKKNLTVTGDKFYLNGDKDGELMSTTLQVGDVVAFYGVDKNTAAKAVVTRYTADVITDVDTDVKKADAEDGVSAYVTFEKAGTFNNTDIAGYSANAYVEDAVVALIEGNKEILDSYVADSVEGAISAYTSSTYTLDGTKYTKTGNAIDEIDKVDFEDGSYKLYLDVNGYVIKAEVLKGSVTIDDVFYLADINSDNVYWVETETSKGKTTNSYYVQAVYLDGTVEDVKVAEAAENTDKNAKVVAYLKGLEAGFYTKDTKTVKYDTDKTYDVTLKAWSDSDYNVSGDLADGSLEITSSTKKLDGAYLNKDTQYVVVESYNDNVKVTTKTGSISYEDEAADVVRVISKTVNGSPVVQYVVILSDSFTTAAAGDYFYVDDASATTVSGGKQYTVYNKDGDEVQIVVDKDSTIKTLVAGTFYEYAEMTNGNYDVKGTLDSDVMDVTTFVSYYGDALTVAGNDKVVDTANAAIVDTHDTDGDYSKTISTLAGMQTAQKAGYNVYLKVVYTDSKKEAAQIIVVYNVADKGTVDMVNDSVEAIKDANGKFEVNGSDVTVAGDNSYIGTTDDSNPSAPMKISADLAKFLGALKNTGKATEIKYEGKTYTWITSGTGVTELKGSNWRTGNDTDGYTTLVKAITDDWKNGGEWKTNVTYTATLTVDGVDMTYTVSVAK